MQPGRCCVRRGWIGMILSEYSRHYVRAYHSNFTQRTKEGLKSGKIQAKGDAWPKFLYAGYKREKGRSWKGLFRSQLLLNVFHIISALFLHSVLILIVIGLQVRIHVPKLGRKRRFQSHAFWER